MPVMDIKSFDRHEYRGETLLVAPSGVAWWGAAPYSSVSLAEKAIDKVTDQRASE